jgi:hypothetical protein
MMNDVQCCWFVLTQSLLAVRLVYRTVAKAKSAATHLTRLQLYISCTASDQHSFAMVTYTIDDCKQHVSDKDCWLVVHGGPT